jgi:hypothetical protein
MEERGGKGVFGGGGGEGRGHQNGKSFLVALLELDGVGGDKMVADKINIFRCMYIYVSVDAGSVISKNGLLQ